MERRGERDHVPAEEVLHVVEDLVPADAPARARSDERLTARPSEKGTSRIQDPYPLDPEDLGRHLLESATEAGFSLEQEDFPEDDGVSSDSLMDESVDLERWVAEAEQETSSGALEDRNERIIASEIMHTRQIVCAGVESSFNELMELFRSSGERCLPVAFADGTLAGLIDERDLGRVWLAKDALTKGSDPLLNFSVRDAMTRNVVRVTPQATLAEMVALMLDRRIDVLPVVDSSRDLLVGFVTQTDLLRILSHGQVPPLEGSSLGS